MYIGILLAGGGCLISFFSLTATGTLIGGGLFIGGGIIAIIANSISPQEELDTIMEFFSSKNSERKSIETKSTQSNQSETSGKEAILYILFIIVALAILISIALFWHRLTGL